MKRIFWFRERASAQRRNGSERGQCNAVGVGSSDAKKVEGWETQVVFGDGRGYIKRRQDSLSKVGSEIGSEVVKGRRVRVRMGKRRRKRKRKRKRVEGGRVRIGL